MDYMVMSLTNPHTIRGSRRAGVFVVFYIQMGSNCARRSLRSPWKLGLGIVA